MGLEDLDQGTSFYGLIAMRAILIVCPEEDSREKLVTRVLDLGLQPFCSTNCSEAQGLLGRQNFSVVLCSDSLMDGDYRDVIKTAIPTPVIVLSHLAEWGPYLAALEAGAFDYIVCPPDRAEVDRILSFALNEHSQFSRAAA
jgi:DNA-binding NtrC family response regulator